MNKDAELLRLLENTRLDMWNASKGLRPTFMTILQKPIEEWTHDDKAIARACITMVYNEILLDKVP